jgi:hypothetical protein
MTGLLFAMAIFGVDAAAGATDYAIHQSEADLARAIEAHQDDLDDKDEIVRLSRKWSRARESRDSTSETTADEKIQEWLAAEMLEGTEEVAQARREVTSSRHALTQSRKAHYAAGTTAARQAFEDDLTDLQDDVEDLEGVESRLARTSALRDDLIALEDSFGWRISKKEQAEKQALLRRIVRHSQRSVVASAEERDEDRAERSEAYRSS